MFWTCRIAPTDIPIDAAYALPNGTVMSGAISKVPNPPVLLRGNATVTEIFTKARLDKERALHNISMRSNLLVSAEVKAWCPESPVAELGLNCQGSSECSSPQFGGGTSRLVQYINTHVQRRLVRQRAANRVHRRRAGHGDLRVPTELGLYGAPGHSIKALAHIITDHGCKDVRT
ncbi:hypothetical protein DFH09DRAFT_1322788 [Mycena vulgaris]|nr:hypothetical protein DFH09DRAFT_1322788 [Mycena vulgaris]